MCMHMNSKGELELIRLNNKYICRLCNKVGEFRELSYFYNTLNRKVEEFPEENSPVLLRDLLLEYRI